MKLYVYTPYKNYTFGSTIVAANNKREADTVLADNRGIHSIPVEFERVIPGISAKGQPRIVEDTTGEE